MIDCQLHLLIIFIILFQCLISAEGTSCSTCMADIDGPYVENQTRALNFVEMVRVTDSNPAVIVCGYVCCDRGYNFELRIDILDPNAQPQSLRRASIPGSQEYQDSIHDFRVVPIINSASIGQTCDQGNSKTNKYQIHIGSSDVPTLIAKCFVKHSPNFPSTENSTECSGSSTMAIVPGYSSPENSIICISPSKTVSPSSTLEPTVSESPGLGQVGNLLFGNKTNDCINIHKIYGSILAVMVFLAILILLAVILCTQKLKNDPQLCMCKKTKNEVEMKLIKNDDKRTVTVAWEKKDSSIT